MTVKSTRLFYLGLILVFFLALFPRISQATTRSNHWYGRAYRFWDGLKTGDLSQTYQQYHPGVTTMWIAGIGMEAYRLTNGLAWEQVPSRDSTDPRAPSAQAGLIAMGVVISGSILLTTLLLTKIVTQLAALTSGFFLALDPFYITHSQMIHVDAFLATFMLVSVVSWLVFLSQKRLGYLVLSGVFTGLALLTKSPAWFLLPFISLVTVLYNLSSVNWRVASSVNNRLRQIEFRRTVINLSVWILIAVVVFLILWPAMWIKPVEILKEIFSAALLHTETAHPAPQFFAGNIVEGDPGLLFYLATIAWKTTSITSVGGIAALVFQIGKRRTGLESRFYGFILLYIIGFILMMSLGAKKWGRYILPAVTAIDLLAGWGIIKLSALFSNRIRRPKRLMQPNIPILIAVLLQILLVMRHSPNFGTHHNLLFGGSVVAQRVLPMGLQGEGLDMAASFLNTLPNAEQIRVTKLTTGALMFNKRFVGQSVSLDQDPDFVLFHINYNQRQQFSSEVGEIWDTCQEDGLFWSLKFDGVNYIWLCAR